MDLIEDHVGIHCVDREGPATGLAALEGTRATQATGATATAAAAGKAVCIAVIAGASSEAFLGTQGYVWDTQSDMAMAGLGAVLALLTLSAWHDRQLAALTTDPDHPGTGGTAAKPHR